MAQPFSCNSYLHISDIPTQVLSRPQRTWPALLTLIFLAPIIPEMLTGSTPPIMYINPISLLFETGLYGSGAKIPGWGTQHHLALATGVISFLVLLGPLSEFVSHPARKKTTGLTIVNMTFLIGLILLARLVATREKPTLRIEAR